MSASQATAELSAQFGIPDVLKFATTPDGLTKGIVSLDGVSAEFFVQGAQLTEWTVEGGRPILFTSPQSAFAPGKAIRGGIPIVFPWFGPAPAGSGAPQHGFARVAAWTLSGVDRTGSDTLRVKFTLESDMATQAFWPQPFRIVYEVAIGRNLALDLTIENPADHEIRCEAAFHTYFAVSDVTGVSVTGLDGRPFIDKVDGGTRKQQPAGAMKFTGPIDSVYLGTGDRSVIHDPQWQRRIVVSKSGAASTVVWNPWKAMADLAGDGWKSMLCVESANAADDALRLAPNGRHRISTTIAVEAESAS